jgi:putative ABC transport system substrate-binding protein
MWPLAAAGQQTAKVWRVGQVLFGTVATTGALAAALEKRLTELGDGRLAVVTTRYVAPDPKAAESEIAALSREIDLLVVWSTIGGVAAKRLGSSLPVVFLSVGAPVEIGLVPSLAHPGGTMTGVTFEASTETYAKRLQILKEIMPALERVAVLRAHGDANVPFAMQSLERSAPQLGITLQPVEVASADDLDSAFGRIAASGGQALIIIAGSLTFVANARIAALTLVYRLPSCSGFRETVQAGGLVSLGPDFIAIARQGAGYVDKIIHGSKPSDLPVEQPTRYEIYVNQKTAKALGLAIPPSLLARADEVIE